MRKFLLAMAAALFQLAAPANAEAAPMVTYEFVGTVFESSGNWSANGVTVGDSVSGFFAYDLATPDGNPGDGGGLYDLSQPGLFSLAVDGFEFRAGHVQILVFDNVPFDRFTYHVVPPVSSGAITLSSGFVVLEDSASAALDGDDLPTTLSLADWDVTRIWLGADPAGGSVLGIEITALTRVPEPATLGLLAAAMIGLAVVGWRARGEPTLSARRPGRRASRIG